MPGIGVVCRGHLQMATHALEGQARTIGDLLGQLKSFGRGETLPVITVSILAQLHGTSKPP